MKRLLGAAALVCFGAFSLFASSAGVMPVPEQQFFDANGLPLSGGYIYTCVAGTGCPGNPLATYTDASGTTANPNPRIGDRQLVRDRVAHGAIGLQLLAFS